MRKRLSIILISALFACNKSETLNTTMPNGSEAKHVYGYYPGVTIQTIENIGSEHNLVLDASLDNFDWSSSTRAQDMRDFYDAYVNSMIDTTEVNRDSILDFVQNAQSNLALHMESAVYNFMTDAVNDLDSVDSYSELVTLVADLKSNAQSNFVGFDKDLLLVFLETTKKSGYYWMPLSSGGSGVGDLVLDDRETNWPSSDRPTWQSVVAADGMGAAGAFLYIGASGLWAAAAVPTTLAGLAAVVGWSAAYSSAGELLFG